MSTTVCVTFDRVANHTTIRLVGMLAATPAGDDIEWHMIGPIQSNKTRAIAERFQWVHSVERAKIAQRLHDARPAQLSPLNVCIEVNVSGEHSKS